MRFELSASLARSLVASSGLEGSAGRVFRRRRTRRVARAPPLQGLHRLAPGAGPGTGRGLLAASPRRVPGADADRFQTERRSVERDLRGGQPATLAGGDGAPSVLR